MKISRGDPADDEMRADLTEYLQQKEKISVIIKVLEEFRSQREEILLTAEQSETDDILEDNDLDKNVIMNMQCF
ncbi:hypothetical protein BDBG_17131 [Blastomyces gilchristii SLH14081]|uniref:Uncharacterized protein n=1 Tax=Blastomyces gilchristii (strain SLH14081) TaxID=559298 RepID=A0A179ULF4_BLAGS|nr:uncharacterized protein BDBG_17131 [Blastomyces gilchristii SLH14081]OAT08905.1 hypothetical protein BDBG_17131 [Blastomyces gilchristii SLH14081]